VGVAEGTIVLVIVGEGDWMVLIEDDANDPQAVKKSANNGSSKYFLFMFFL
jgi:hypothetical protein